MAHLLSLLCLLCLLCLVDRSSSSCAVVQDDPNDCPLTWPVGPDGTTCVPRPAGYNGDGTNRDSELEAHPYVPFMSPYGPVPNICPQYPNVCCSNNQMQSLQQNFKGIWSNFGDIAGGGCPACYQNVIDFWCAYTCSPNQTNYVNGTGLAQKVDPVSGNEYTVFTTAATLDTRYACDMFSTCSATGRVKEFSPLQTCEGFLKYQGQTEAIQTGLSFIEFQFANASNRTLPPMITPLYSCCNFPSTISQNTPGAGNGSNISCPCASCAGMCAGGACLGGQAGAYQGLGYAPDNPLLGFNSSIIAIVAGLVLAVSIPLVLWRGLHSEAGEWEGEGGEQEEGGAGSSGRGGSSGSSSDSKATPLLASQ